MSNSTINLVSYPIGREGRRFDLPVDGGSHLYQGTLISQLAGTGAAVPGSTASSGPAIGVATHEISNSGSDGDKRVTVESDRIFEFANGSDTDACSEATKLFSVVYMIDDHTVADNSAGNTRQAAGRFCGMSENGKVRVYVGMANLGDALADAGDIDIADAGLFTTATDVEEALQELYQGALSAQAQVNVPLTAFTVVSTGAPVVAFNDGSADGLDFTEGQSYRFNPSSTAAIGATIPMPQDLDDTANVVVHILAARVGSSDTTAVITVGAFFQVAGAARDADNNCGGNSGALNAATTVLQEATVTLAAADVPAAPCALSLTLVPSAALDADDLCIHAVWLEYKRKLLAS